LKDKNGNFVDKDGNRVNEKGYLVDEKGNIIDNQHHEKMFDKSELTDKGEIPAPFGVEKHNFNPHNIRGDFNHDKTGKPLISKNKQGDFVDKKGKKVNKKGYKTDKNGNIIDKHGKKKFDKK